MKKNILSLAVASSVAGLAVTAQAAMYLNPEGTGQVLLFPYYNAQNGNETSMHIVNTTSDAKAVKVRFMEYVNSQEVLDFNLYLSARDHFSFTIFQQGDGGAIVTADNSCTVPELGTGSGDFGGTQETLADGTILRKQPFVNYAYGVTGTDTIADNYSSITRSLVGHVEIIEMGVVGDEATDNDADTTEFTPATWATHGADGVPANCAGLVAAWTKVGNVNGAWLANNDAEISAPSGGLYGVANMLNNSDSAAYGMEAAAIADFWDSNLTSGHEKPGDALPSLAQGEPASLIANNGVYYTLAYPNDRGVDAVSSLFMAETIANDVMADPALQGETDWVVTFPTRRYYVSTDPAVKPFTDPYVGSGTAGGPETSCEDVTIVQTDREESEQASSTTPPSFSPEPPDQPAGVGPQLCYETNTIAINGVSALNASVSTATVADAAKTLAWSEDQPAGWQTITFDTDNYLDATTSTAGANKTRLKGLPVLGFAAFEYTNGTKNFGFVSDHKTSVAGSAIGD